MKLDPAHIYRGKDLRRESLIAEQLESGLLKEHPDKEKEQIAKSPYLYDNDKVLTSIHMFLESDLSACKFEKANGLGFGLISKAKREFIDNGLHVELVAKLEERKRKK